MVTKTDKSTMPILPLRDVVVYPNMVVPLFVGRTKSIKSLEDAMNNNNKTIMLVTQLSADINDPIESELYDIGCTATILQLLKLPDGTVKVLVEGRSRVKIEKFLQNDNYFEGEASPLQELSGDVVETEALCRSVAEEFEKYTKLRKSIPEEVLSTVSETKAASKLADIVCGHLGIELADKQSLLEELDIVKRLESAFSLMKSELSVLKVEKKIKTRVKTQMEKTQREYYLNEQMKAIQKELGDGEDQSELDELIQKIGKTKLSREASEKVEGELKKLKNMSPMSAEATVVRNY